mmetsp:Transcript_22770/g.54509  ORF Transcript_22770/g.54509 Transcript_22770/m.54509 type:complete len:351 (-) Transcript_22770:256-1308(-)
MCTCYHGNASCENEWLTCLFLSYLNLTFCSHMPKQNGTSPGSWQLSSSGGSQDAYGGMAGQTGESSFSSGPAEQPSSSEAADSERDSPPSSERGELVFVSGAEMIPHPDKRDRGGEDSYFVSSSGTAIGVADGVGGWAEIGIDAGLYSRMLMNYCLEAVDEEVEMSAASPMRILKNGYSRTKAQGSCTACIITLGEETLHAANLGDSGFIILRAGKIVFKSPQQQHDFNFPYQLGNADGMSDPPEAAATFSVPVMEGDIVVAATDGVFDNLFADEIARVAILTKQAGESPLQAAQHLAALAHHRAGDSYTMSPFGMAAQQVGFIYRGGKMDDITVVVSYVQKRETPSPKL